MTSAQLQTDVRRALLLFNPTLGVPVASLMVSNTMLHSNHSPGPASGRSGALDGTSARGSHRSTRFVLTRTEDAVVPWPEHLPCGVEELFKPMMKSKFADPAKLNFRYHHQK